jgi:hypothetical protein
VVLTTGQPDQAGVEEGALVSKGLPYLKEVWHDDSWRLFAVEDPTPLADPPALVTSFDAAQVVIRMPRAGQVLVRIPDSPWLSLVDEDGKPLPGPTSPSEGAPAINEFGCLSEAEQPHKPDEAVDKWTVLHAPHAGTYRIAAPYKLPRGTSCPDQVGDSE